MKTIRDVSRRDYYFFKAASQVNLVEDDGKLKNEEYICLYKVTTKNTGFKEI